MWFRRIEAFLRRIVLLIGRGDDHFIGDEGDVNEVVWVTIVLLYLDVFGIECNAMYSVEEEHMSWSAMRS